MCMRPVMFILLLASGCHEKLPKAGDVCGGQDEGTFVCQDAKTALLCKAEVRKVMPCLGPQGCTGGAHATCDQTFAHVGDPCKEPQFSYSPMLACSEDKQTQLECRNGRLELALHCRGPRGCDGATCDRSLLAAGDECYALDGWEKCSIDGKATVACNNESKKLDVVRVCSGPNACRSNGAAGATCDVSAAAIGSPCGSRQPGTRTCDASNDASLLECTSRTHVWARSLACAKGEHCAAGVGSSDAACVR